MTGPGGLDERRDRDAAPVNTYYVWLDRADWRAEDSRDGPNRLGWRVSRPPVRSRSAPRDASPTLGDFNTSPLQVANVYATFCRGGAHCKTIACSWLRDVCRAAADRPADCAQAVDPAIASKINTILQQNIDGPTQPGRPSAAAFGRPAIGKTDGATTPPPVAGATRRWRRRCGWATSSGGGISTRWWMSRPSGTQYPAMYGGQAPALIWQRFMAAAHRDKPVAASRPLLGWRGLPGGPGPQRGWDAAGCGGRDADRCWVWRLSPRYSGGGRRCPGLRRRHYTVTAPDSGTEVVITLSFEPRTDVQIRQGG